MTAFWILKKAKAMPKITVQMTSAPSAWAPSWPNSPLTTPSTAVTSEPFQAPP